MQTLNTFFDTQIESTQWASEVAKSPGIERAKEAIQNELTGFEIPQVFYEMLIRRLCEALNLEIGELLVKGYQKHHEIIQYRDKENPESGFHQVNLVEHSLESKHSPKFEVLVNKQPRIGLTFEVTLQLKFSGGVLLIRDGKIMKITTGSCKGSGKIDFEGVTILKKETAAYDLPGEIPFEPGIVL